MSPSLDIEVIEGEPFTTARVNGRVVAVQWSDGEAAHYVSAGFGPASKFDSEHEARNRFMDAALYAAGGGAAMVAVVDQKPDQPRRAGQDG